MKILLAGGSGFVGRHTARRFVAAGDTLVNLDRRAPAETEAGERYVACDLATADYATLPCGSPDAVVWLAAPIRHHTGVDETAAEDLGIVVEAPLRLLEALKPAPKSFVYMSSILVYGAPRRLPIDEHHPTEPFVATGISKLCAEHCLAIACRTRRIAFTVLRAAFVYGPGQHPRNAIPRFLDALRKNEAPRIYGTGEEIRDDIYVGDVARAVHRSVRRRLTGTFNLATGRPHSLLDVAETACRLSGTGLRPRHEAERGAWVDRWFDVDRARRELGFEAKTSLAEGIEAMWRAEGKS